MSTSLDPRSGVIQLLDQYSIEITAKEANALSEARSLLAPETQVSVTFLANEDVTSRIAAAKVASAAGFRPMPHIAARRLHSDHELEQTLERFQSEVGTDRVFVIAGDPPTPLGPYSDALSVIQTGLFAKYGIRKIGISGYPDGHPDISDKQLRQALSDKLRALAEFGLEAEIVTQFGFDPDPVLAWLRQLRLDGITAPVRVGIPGPTNVTSLIKMATRIGVGATGAVVAKYGISLTKLLGVAGPDTFLETFATRLSPEVHGEVRLHFYTFGSVQRSAGWISNYMALATA